MICMSLSESPGELKIESGKALRWAHSEAVFAQVFANYHAGLDPVSKNFDEIPEMRASESVTGV